MRTIKILITCFIIYVLVFSCSTNCPNEMIALEKDGGHIYAAFMTAICGAFMFKEKAIFKTKKKVKKQFYEPIHK